MQSIHLKIIEDARTWADLWRVPLNIRLFLRILLLEPGFQLAFLIRMQEYAGRIPVVGTFVRRVVWYGTTIAFGCHIDPKCQIGGGIHFPHPTGIVMGGETIVGCRVKILQGVTLGIGGGDEDKSCPRVEDGVAIFAGAKVLGNITIGQNARIGANAVVLRSVPAGHAAVGIPARILPVRTEALVPKDLSHEQAEDCDRSRVV